MTGLILVALISIKLRHVCGMDFERMIVSERTKAFHICIISFSILGMSVNSCNSCRRKKSESEARY